MNRPVRRCPGFTLVETMVSAALIGTLGLIVLSLLNLGTILGTKNTAINTAHQQARMALLQMTRNLNTAVNPPPPPNGTAPLTFFDPLPTPSPTPPPNSFAGVSFQLPAGDSLTPIRLAEVTVANAGSNQITVNLNGNPTPVITLGAQAPHLIIPGYDFEAVITAATGAGTVTLTLDRNVPDELASVDFSTYDVACFTTDVCSYEVNNNMLVFRRPALDYSVPQPSPTPTPNAVLARGITSPYPFQGANGGSGANINLATADTSIALGGSSAGSDQYLSSHGTKSVNDVLNQTISLKDQPDTSPTPPPPPTPTPTPTP